MKVTTILDNIDLREVGLPEFQRGYVWKREDVRRFMNAMYRGWPVGSLLEWNPPVQKTDIRGGALKAEGTVRLIIDGQQRITTLYGISRGKAPSFFEGNPRNFLDLYFHLDTEEFEFYGPVKMKQDRRWIKLTHLFQTDAGTILEELNNVGASGDFRTDLNRLNQLERIFDKDFHIESVSGLTTDVDEVVEIFNEVNSSGTELSAGDLALAKICVDWPQAREELQQRLNKWEKAGFDGFNLDWLLRCVNSTLTGRSRFNAMTELNREQIEQGLIRTERHIDEFLNQIKMQLGLDHSGVLRSPMFVALISRYLELTGGLFGGEFELANVLYLYVNSFMWGRYSYSLEGTLQQDLSALDEGADEKGRIERLIGNYRNANTLLWPLPSAFELSTTGTRFFPLLYLLSRVNDARDLFRNYPLGSQLVDAPLERHHIFPKSLLYNRGFKKREVNQLANFAFLIADTNRRISNSSPDVYLAECEEKNPGVLASQWIPQDPVLWQIDNFLDFLAERRSLLAQAAEDLLSKLYDGRLPKSGGSTSTIEGQVVARPKHFSRR